MEPRFLLDTNICIYIRQNKPEQVLRRFRRLQPGEAALSVITFGELLYGAAKSAQQTAALERLREEHLRLGLVPDATIFLSQHKDSLLQVKHFLWGRLWIFEA